MQTSDERLLALELRGHVWMFRCPAGQEEALRATVVDLALRGDLDPLAASVVETHLRPESRETPSYPRPHNLH
ncbi:MAG: hypothetical protein AAFU75_03805 [Planctomycetota bacterium]|jgi:hypothetical protein|nr:MAG: hypothetical protein CBD11_02360 [Phycisphaera sp. TMED151]RZO53637.1 MAG: hypothetical protein EVA77_06560 [Phycisphaeraceae bacterium]